MKPLAVFLYALFLGITVDVGAPTIRADVSSHSRRCYESLFRENHAGETPSARIEGTL